MFQRLACNRMGMELCAWSGWNYCHLRMDEGWESALYPSIRESGEVGLKPLLCAETLGEDKGKLTYQSYLQRWQQAKMHF